jgi:hypothetical protein
MMNTHKCNPTCIAKHVCLDILAKVAKGYCEMKTIRVSEDQA